MLGVNLVIRLPSAELSFACEIVTTSRQSYESVQAILSDDSFWIGAVNSLRFDRLYLRFLFDHVSGLLATTFSGSPKTGSFVD